MFTKLYIGVITFSILSILILLLILIILSILFLRSLQLLQLIQACSVESFQHIRCIHFWFVLLIDKTLHMHHKIPSIICPIAIHLFLFRTVLLNCLSSLCSHFIKKYCSRYYMIFSDLWNI